MVGASWDVCWFVETSADNRQLYSGKQCYLPSVALPAAFHSVCPSSFASLVACLMSRKPQAVMELSPWVIKNKKMPHSTEVTIHTI